MSSSSQSEVSQTRQGLGPNKALEGDASGTLPLEDIILTGTNVVVPLVVKIAPPNVAALVANDENTKLLVKLDQRLRKMEGHSKYHSYWFICVH